MKRTEQGVKWNLGILPPTPLNYWKQGGGDLFYRGCRSARGLGGVGRRAEGHIELGLGSPWGECPLGM